MKYWKLHLAFWIVIVCLRIIPRLFSTSEGTFNNLELFFILLFNQLFRIAFFYAHYLVLFPKFAGKWIQYSVYSTITVLLFLAAITSYQLILVRNGEYGLDQLPTYMFYLSDFLVLQLLSVVVFKTDQSKEQEEKRLLSMTSSAKIEAAILRSQINPHFMFNSLNTIYALSRKNSSMTKTVVRKLSALMRYSLDSTKSDLIDANTEVTECIKYIELMALRMNHTFETTINVEQLELDIPPLTILTLVENCYKHGDLSSDGYITFMVEKTANGGLFSIRNKVISSNSQTVKGVGITNIEERLKLTPQLGFTLNNELHKSIYSVELEIWKK